MSLAFVCEIHFPLEPAEGFEPPTSGLQNRCATTTLYRHSHVHARRNAEQTIFYQNQSANASGNLAKLIARHMRRHLKSVREHCTCRINDQCRSAALPMAEKSPTFPICRESVYLRMSCHVRWAHGLLQETEVAERPALVPSGRAVAPRPPHR